MKILFVFQQKDQSGYYSELECAYKHNANKSDVSRIDLTELTTDYLINSSVNVVISNGLTKDWYLILKGLRIVTFTIGSLDKYLEWSDIVIDHKSNNSIRYLTGPEYSFNQNSDYIHLINEIFEIILPLHWDTSFFGLNIAFISCKYLSDSVLYQCKEFIKRNKIQFVYYLCNCHDRNSVLLAEKFGFRFVDIKLSFEKKLTNKYELDLNQDYSFALAAINHFDRLKEISDSIYKDSRYYFDGNFPIDKINAFYHNWLEKGILGTFDDECLTLFYQESPIGFCTVKYLKEKAVRIGLVGMAEAFQGKGIGLNLLYNVFNYLIDRKFNKITVVTQGRNYLAQRLYQKAGFLTHSTELWYHKRIEE
ncbi:MAG: GNAT family N-acetyltransferase [Bacteroidetes bacterium]|nr:GNAT family N-acetyltransferase [Bacteroidota bacterium]